MWHVTPEEYTERVKVIEVIEAEYIVETYDGFLVNISNYRVQSGEYVNTIIDKKVKERTALMNSTREFSNFYFIFLQLHLVNFS